MSIHHTWFRPVITFLSIALLTTGIVSGQTIQKDSVELDEVVVEAGLTAILF